MSVEGSNIRFYREASGMKLRELSALSGVSVAHLSDVERGENNLSVDVLKRVSRGLGVTPADLMGEVPQIKWEVCSCCEGRGMVKLMTKEERKG